MLGPSMPKEEMTMKAKNSALTSDTATRAAERLLERKRMGLESAIEALETVGYAVTIDADGRYRVSIPLANTPQKESSPAPVVQGGFLTGYPDLLTQITSQRYPA